MSDPNLHHPASTVCAVPDTHETSRSIARVAVWATLVYNLLLLGADLGSGSYRFGTMHAFFVVLLTSWQWFTPKLEARLDALTGQAVAARRMNELALEQLQAQHRAGNLRVDVAAERRAFERMN